MLAYKIAIFLLLFNLSIGIVGAMGVFQTPVGMQGEAIPTSILNTSLWDWKTLLISATGIITVIVSIALRMSVGACLFALIFTASFLPVSSTFNLFERIGLNSVISTGIQGILAFVFIFAFIQIAGGGTYD